MTGSERVGHVVVAPDKFKGSLAARDVATYLAVGIRRARPEAEVRALPVADGGDGTVDAAVAAGFRRVTRRVTGPTGEPVDAALAVRGDTAVVEMAEASGLKRLPGGRPAARTATSFGTGELIRAALDAGARRVVLGIGGSACTDGGAGMLAALGARLTGTAGNPLPLGGAALTGVDRIDLAGLDPRLAATTLVLASDVDNPLLGPHGAAAVYGPQKGATPDDVELLDAALGRFADAVAAATGRDLRAAPGAGAAGGTGFAALAVLGARRRPGIDEVLDVVGFADALPGAALVVTGEGSLDSQTLRGKAPVGVASAARRAGVPVAFVAGRVQLSRGERAELHATAVYALTDLADPDTAMRDAPRLLEEVGARLAAECLPPPH